MFLISFFTNSGRVKIIWIIPLNTKIATITLNIGNRYLDGQVNNSNYYSKGEIIKDYFTKEYTVVGIIKKDVYESYSEVGFNVFTYKEKLDNQMLYIIYKNPKKTIELTNLWYNDN